MTHAWLIILIAVIVGRWLGLHTPGRGLLLILGIYAVLVGLRLLLIKLKMAADGNIQGGVSMGIKLII